MNVAIPKIKNTSNRIPLLDQPAPPLPPPAALPPLSWDLKASHQGRENGEDLPHTLNYIRKNYHNWFNWITVLSHTLGAMLPFTSLVPASVSKKVKNFAIQFSRWGVPLVKFHTGCEAIYGKRAFEAIARIAPTLFLPILPFFNFQLAYGLSSGINVVLEHMGGRIGELKREDGFAVNNRKVMDGLKSMFTDLMNPNTELKERSKLSLALGGAGFMLAGAIPALIFARDSLNSIPAKIFGSIRSIGGFLGDLSIILFSSKPTPEERRKEQIVGSFFFIPTIMDLLQRWINQDSDANEIFNHAKTSLNTIAEVLWSSFSTDRNTKPKPEEQKKFIPNLFQSLMHKAMPNANLNTLAL